MTESVTRVAVTGAAGRVGRAVLADLAAAGGYEVWAIDRTLVPAASAARSLLVDLADAGSVYGALAGATIVGVFYRLPRFLRARLPLRCP